jgi:adenine/guanine phosphoribosyltransferase-like PRPP-binding protein
LVNFVKKARAEVSGVYSLIAVGEDWRQNLKLPKGSPVEVVIKLNKKDSRK